MLIRVYIWLEDIAVARLQDMVCWKAIRWRGTVMGTVMSTVRGAGGHDMAWYFCALYAGRKAKSPAGAGLCMLSALH